MLGWCALAGTALAQAPTIPEPPMLPMDGCGTGLPNWEVRFKRGADVALEESSIQRLQDFAREAPRGPYLIRVFSRGSGDEDYDLADRRLRHLVSLLIGFGVPASSIWFQHDVDRIENGTAIVIEASGVERCLNQATGRQLEWLERHCAPRFEQPIGNQWPRGCAAVLHQLWQRYRPYVPNPSPR